MEGNVTHILANNLTYTPFVFLSRAPQMLGAVLQKPEAIIPPNFYPLTLNIIIECSQVDSGSHLRGNVKANTGEM